MIEPSQAPPFLVDIDEAARLLSVSRKTLWNKTAPRGDIPSVRLGRVVRYSRVELEQWIARQCDLSSSKPA